MFSSLLHLLVVKLFFLGKLFELVHFVILTQEKVIQDFLNVFVSIAALLGGLFSLFLLLNSDDFALFVALFKKLLKSIVHNLLDLVNLVIEYAE